ncbi:uncharacterized protein LOC105420785 [Amborella trichopoda]|uniref:uncharacterized protein LOC105420785 n=1 Tax=Amborella trichopoda TaxID=13333 RepID=UPI0005D32602|nr:uncharacterized protein LOC105420785 [Amborella trichopoda]|eukprot:XP_011624164.1 uncharacterized protein LOC105420785 [Amborella trichopoda]
MSRTRSNNASSTNENTEALSEFVRTLGAMIQMMKEAMPTPSTPAHDQNDINLIEKFRRLAPPTFLGLGGVEKVEMEKIFDVLNCIDEQKVRLGTFVLEGDTKHWWGLVKQSWEESRIEASWGKFHDTFNEKYFPDSVEMSRTHTNHASSSDENTEGLGELMKALGVVTQAIRDIVPASSTPASDERKEVEFIEQQQGNMSVEQYAAKFAELSKYALDIISSKVQKASKFERGLQPDIRRRIIAANLKTFALLVDLALKMERDDDEFRVSRDGRLGVQSRGFKKKERPPPRREWKGRNNQGHLNVKPVQLVWTLVVCAPMGESIETDVMYKLCGIVIEGHLLLIDLIMLGIQDFDNILGMDWFSTHHATMNYFDKIITFGRPGQPKLYFKGIKNVAPLHIISALRASRLLAKRCIGYLAYVVENQGVQSKLEEIPMVREYPEVFLEELTSLPPVMKIEFELEVAPDTTPISTAPFKMAPVELKELKEKL